MESPHSIAPYRLESLLGRGGMGEVYLAYDPRLQRRVAIKNLRRDRDRDSDTASGQRFRREARAAAALAHPNIVQIFDLLETEEGDWIVMEHIEGETLADRLSTGPMTVPATLDLASEVLDGLAYAHRQGFIHRDLKTENVMLSAEGRVKILDFGLAKRLSGTDSSLTVDGAVLGTCRAMSPEQAMGLELDAKSDLFSLGVLIYEALSGISPFQGSSPAATLTRICTHGQNALHELDVDIPEELSNLVDQLLAKTPTERPNAPKVLHQMAALRRRYDPMEDADADRTDAGDAADTWTRSVGDGLYLGPTLAPDGSAAGAPRPLLQSVARRGKILSWVLLVCALLGASWWWQQRPSEAASAVAQGLAELSVEEVQQQLRQGMDLLFRFDREGNIDRALKLFRGLVARRSDLATTHAGLSRALWRKARQTQEKHWRLEAVEVAERAVEIDPYLASAQVSLGLANIEVDPERARQALGTALRLDPSSADAYRGLGLLHEKLEDTEAALAAYRRASEIWPEDRELQDLMGILFFRQSRLEKAETHFSRSIELAPDNVFGYLNLAGVHFMREEYDEAGSLLQQALELQPQADIYTNLGTIYFYQGLYEQSIGPFRKAVETDEGRIIPLLWTNLGDAYRWAPGYDAETREAYGRSIELLRQRLADQPGEDLYLRGQLALVLSRRGDWQEALQEAQSLEDHGDLGPDIHYVLAMAYEQCGQRPKALAALAQALEQGLPLAAVEREQELDRLRDDPAFERLRAEDSLDPIP